MTEAPKISFFLVATPDLLFAINANSGPNLLLMPDGIKMSLCGAI